MELKTIATIQSDFPTKFGIPRQSGLAEDLKARIIFEPEYRVAEAVRGLEGFSYIWLIWQFSQSVRKDWSPTVRPPRLGGNQRMGVFATRSPFRPNALGLSSVKLIKIQYDGEWGPTLWVSGADLMDKTPIYDIKPYLPYADSHPEAKGGFTDCSEGRQLQVSFPRELLERIDEDRRQGLIQSLKQDPRPSYQKDPGRIYGFFFGGREIKFRVDDKEGVLTVLDVKRM